MYANHVPLLSDHGRTGDGVADLVTFALLSIRQPFTLIPRQFRDVRKRGAKSQWLFGFKLPGYIYVKAHGAILASDLNSTPDAVDAIEILTRVPGLGIVKAAFVAQMLGYDVACFDSRNAKVLGLGSRPFRTDGKPPLRRRVVSYVAMTRDTGGAEYWWDNWCERVAVDRGRTPMQISAMHLEVLK